MSEEDDRLNRKTSNLPYASLLLACGLISVSFLLRLSLALNGSGSRVLMYLLGGMGGAGFILAYAYLLRPADRHGLEAELADAAKSDAERRLRRIAYAACFLTAVIGFVVGKVVLLQLSPGKVFPDTLEYIRVSQNPMFSADFWAGRRPPILPLMYKLLAVDPSNYTEAETLNRIGRIQVSMSVLAWGGLGGALVSSLRRRWFRPLAFALILSLGLSLHISQWDSLALSESLSTSLFVGWLGAGIWIVRHAIGGPPTRMQRAVPVFFMFLVISLGLALVRDLNAFLLLGMALLIAPLPLFFGFRHMRKGAMLVVLAILLTSFIAGQASANRGDRWLVPFLGVLHQRIFTNQSATEYFEAAGMPVGEWEKVPVTQDGRSYFLSLTQHDPSADAFKRWVLANGRTTYAKYLSGHPRVLIGHPLRDLSSLLSPLSVEYRNERSKTPVWLEWLTAIMYPLLTWLIIGWAACVLGGAIWRARRGSFEGWWVVPLGLLILVPPMMLLVWHADPVELERHAYPIGLQLRLAVWMLTIGLIDQYASDKPQANSMQLANRS